MGEERWCWWGQREDQVDGQSVDLGSLGYELKVLNMHDSMVFVS